MKHWDAVVIGAGIIGVSLAIELHKRGMRVLVVDKGEPGREASWAAGGMLADYPLEMPGALEDLARASARMYPEFVHELEDESRLKIDLRANGTLVFVEATEGTREGGLQSASSTGGGQDLPRPLAELEPGLDVPANTHCLYLKERSVDPRQLTAAAIGAAKHRGIDFSSGNHVEAIEVAGGKTVGVRTNKTTFAADAVVNCAGAWSGQIVAADSDADDSTFRVPTRPVKGQMLCLVMPRKELVRHVVRAPQVYLIPRSDGRMVIGATQEEAGYDKQTVPETIQKLRQAALEIVPALAEARVLEAWAGLRPGTPDGLPILGSTSIPEYFVATGHFRDGILLAPGTAKVMAQLICGERPEFDLKAFGAGRFCGQ